MKFNPALVVALAVGAASSLFAQAPAPVVPGQLASVTFALTATYSVPGIRLVDPETKEVSFVYDNTVDKLDADDEVILTTTTSRSIMRTDRVDNRKILTDMIADDLLGDDTSPAGWTIVQVAAGEDDSDPAFYAVKAGRAPVRIVMRTAEIGNAESSSSTYVEDYVRDTERYSASGSYRASTRISLGDFNLGGTVNGSFRYVEGTLGTGASARSYAMFVEGAIRITGLSGSYSGVDAEDDGVAEGAINITAARVVDILALGFDIAAP